MLKVMNSVMPVYWVPKTMMHVVIKTVNYGEIKGPYVVIKIRHVARIANI